MQTCHKQHRIQTLNTRSVPCTGCCRIRSRCFSQRSCMLRSSQRPASVRVQASLREVVDGFVTYGSVSVSLAAIAYTIFHDWRNESRRQAADGTASSNIDDNFTWGVMGVVSCLPLFNFMAWVLGALQSDSPRPYYWAAALYTLPLLRNGFDQDWYSVTLLLLGIAHVQALRIAATEPEIQAKLQQSLKPLAVIRAAANTAGTAVDVAIGTGGGRSSRSGQQRIAQGSSSRSIKDFLQGKDEEDIADGENFLQKLELEEFDRRLQMKSQNKQKQ